MSPTECARCGARLAPDAKYCSECGLRVGGDPAGGADAPPHETTAWPRERGSTRRGFTLAKPSSRALGRARERTSWMIESVAIRSGVGRELARLRAHVLQRFEERERLLRELGAAVYGHDDEATEKLRERLTRLDLEVRGQEEEMQAIVEQAHERLEQGRRRVEPTLIEPPQPAPVPEPSPPPDEGTPPTPPAIPEPSPPPDEATPPQPPRIPEPGPGREL